MKTTAILTVLTLFLSGTILSQEKDNTPVYSPWSCSVNIDNQTTETPEKGAKEYLIQHRFGKISEISDLYGIYAPSNIRMAFNYAITDKIMVGVGTEKDNKLQDIQWKYNFLQQTESGSMPVSVAYFGNVAIDARDKEVFGADMKFTHRLSFFHQLIIGRKFNERLSVQLGGGYSHFNSVDSIYLNDYFGFTAGARYKVYNEISLIAEYSQSFPLADTIWLYQQNDEPEPNLSFGVELGTGTHSFQIFAAQYKHIVAQKNMGFNQNALDRGDWLLGFNIIVRFY